MATVAAGEADAGVTSDNQSAINALGSDQVVAFGTDKVTRGLALGTLVCNRRLIRRRRTIPMVSHQLSHFHRLDQQAASAQHLGVEEHAGIVVVGQRGIQDSGRGHTVHVADVAADGIVVILVQQLPVLLNRRNT